MKLFTCGLLALALPAMAFNTVHTFNPNPVTGGTDGLQLRGESQKSLRIARKAPARTPKQRTNWAFGKDITYYEQYGTLKELLYEDFSNLTLGTEEKPDTYTLIDIPYDSDEYTYPWWNFIPDYTHQPNWGVGAAWGAGGTLYWKLDLDCPQAHFNTCLVDVSEGEGVFIIEFRARRSEGSTQNYVYVEAAETNNMGPSWDTCDDPVMIEVGSTDWTTYRIMFRGGGPTTLINVVGELISDNPYVSPKGYQEIWFDDIRVYQLMTNIAAPKTLPVSDYKGTSFTANWLPVSSAGKYLLSCWSLDDMTGEKQFLLEDKEVTSTSYGITGAVSGQIYYYSLKSVGNGYTSLEGFSERVYKLETPVLEKAVKTGDYSYQAAWNAVPGADVYNYTAYAERVAREDGPFVVTSENFDGILDLDGYPTGWTKEDPEGYSYQEYYCNELRQQRWLGKWSAPYDGYIAFDSYWYESGQGDAGFISPELDLSKDGGKFTVAGDFAGDIERGWDINDNPYTAITQTCLALFNWDAAAGDYVQVELLYPAKEITNDWQRLEFNFTKGSARSKIGIFAIRSNSNLYLDNLLITQNYKAGESLLDPYLYKRYHGSNTGDIATQIDVNIPGRAEGWKLYHTVSAYGRQVDAWGNSYDDRESLESELEFVMETVAGIDQVVAVGEAEISLDGETIRVSNPNGEAVTVFTADGRQLASSAATDFSYRMTQRGIYIVAVGRKALKVSF
ncbi:MAG: hypothetical protein NC336_07005 [Clostridium sp.]|nr:hypothetical protein [Clostridium sp.]